MNTIATTLRIAHSLGIEPGAALHDGPWSTGGGLTEWSLNARDDVRGALRFGTWFDADDPGVREFVSRRMGQEIAALRDGLPSPESEGVGLAFRPGRAATTRWWQLVRDGEGDAFWQKALSLRREFDQLMPLVDRIGPERAVAVGAESEAGVLTRLTLYLACPTPRIALETFAWFGIEANEDIRRFVYDLVGWNGVVEGTRPWPKIWIGKSFIPFQKDSGRSAGLGLKLYYFVRGMDQPPSEDELMRYAGASETLIPTWRAEARLGHACRIVGLTLPVSGGARWTIYLASR